MSTGSKTKSHSTKNSFSDFLAIADSMRGAMLAEAAATDATDSFPAETFRTFAENGLLRAVLPEKFGGAGTGIEDNSSGELLNLLKTFW